MLLPLLLVFVLGVCVGSFVNVLVFRLPESQSIVRPGSRCRSCGKPLAWYENIPLLSYLVQAGKCRGCGVGISLQYPLVELAVGGLFAGNFLLAAGASRPSPDAAWDALADPRWIVGAVFTTLLLAIALTDVRTYIIPDELSLGGLLVGLLLSLAPGGLSPAASFLGALAGGGVLLAVAWAGALLFRKEAMGGGDIKMLGMIGAFLGWQGAFVTLFLGALLGSVIYGPIALLHRARSARSPAAAAPEREAPDPLAALTDESSGLAEEADVDRALVPFGFFLAPAAALAFYLGDEIVRGYLGLVGLGP